MVLGKKITLQNALIQLYNKLSDAIDQGKVTFN